jgi:hypothetical protein
VLTPQETGTGWHVPPSRSNGQSESAGLYASDRGMFAFFVSDENPIEVGYAKVGRSFFCWNSETGSCTFGLMTFLYNYGCGNHIVWGVEEVNELHIIHRHHAINRLYSHALPVLNRFVENRVETGRIKQQISQAMNFRLGDSLDQVQTWFRNRLFNRTEITRVWEIGETESAEGDEPTTLWGIVQGLTAYARNLPHTDRRVDLERRAGALLNS